MRSKYADEFNHDEDAPEYDADVLREREDPIRTGYEDCLTWVIEKAKIQPTHVVLDLGSGTGNLSVRIMECNKLVCVDVSEKMSEIARPKLVHLSDVQFVHADVLEFFDQNNETYDAILSTYTIHHLLEDEKQLFFEQVWDALNPGGVAIFGDLMLESESRTYSKISEYVEKEQRWVAGAIMEEFFWFVDSAKLGLEQLGFAVEVERFSDLSWGICAQKPA